MLQLQHCLIVGYSRITRSVVTNIFHDRSTVTVGVDVYKCKKLKSLKRCVTAYDRSRRKVV